MKKSSPYLKTYWMHFNQLHIQHFIYESSVPVTPTFTIKKKSYISELQAFTDFRQVAVQISQHKVLHLFPGSLYVLCHAIIKKK